MVNKAMQYTHGMSIHAKSETTMYKGNYDIIINFHDYIHFTKISGDLHYSDKDIIVWFAHKLNTSMRIQVLKVLHYSIWHQNCREAIKQVT
jgi:hypothetical protein